MGVLNVSKEKVRSTESVGSGSPIICFCPWVNFLFTNEMKSCSNSLPDGGVYMLQMAHSSTPVIVSNWLSIPQSPPVIIKRWPAHTTTGYEILMHFGKSDDRGSEHKLTVTCIRQR
ncbi:hypothetical protein CEXT_495801 [Caerostris extrusa]|uniref:Uncharacterized protein n=1 Tax=Caerostris extrusa TaxID=172846 RepID=A0AAV4RTU9_CAEEX|nr:hypothetical protein CEXT_495801 [Caerostris extrusa]